MVSLRNWFDIPDELKDTIWRTLGDEVFGEEEEPINELCRAIVLKWKAKAEEDDDPPKAFKALHKANRRNAIASIIAALELLRKVGDGKPLLSDEDRIAVAQLERF